MFRGNHLLLSALWEGEPGTGKSSFGTRVSAPRCEGEERDNGIPLLFGAPHTTSPTQTENKKEDVPGAPGC